MKTALIAGATGLVGSNLLALLLDDSFYSKVITITRKPLANEHPKHQNIVVDFDRLSDLKDQLHADHVFCCLGTTMKRAGSKEAFWKVDHDYPLQLAKITKENGAESFLLVSALGADKTSSFYYNQVKGHIENDIESLNFESYYIFRPSLLLGDRNESRAGEDAAKVVYRWFGFLIPQKYKGIEGKTVAKAMQHFAKGGESGKHIKESAVMQQYKDK